jgi:hypothetical protein
VAGVDTIRGIAFQHAYAIQLALDVIDDPDAATLTIEGAADVVDVELARRKLPARPIFQIKSRQEPYGWPPGDVADVIRRWQEAGGGADAPLRFVSDAPASPETATKLKPALERAAMGQLSDDDRRYLRSLGIDPEAAAHIELATRSDRTGALLAMAENRLRRLLALAGPVADDAPGRAIDRLFRQFAVEGGDQRIERRTFTREELVKVLDLELTLIDAGDAWTAPTVDEYRAAVAGGRTPHALVELAALLDPTAATPALALLATADDSAHGPQVAQPAVNLVDRDRGAGLCGAAGTGKTTTAQQMATRAAGDGRTAIVVFVGGYRRGDLHRRIRRALEDVLSRPLAPSVVDTALSETEATLLVDGLAGLTPEQEDALAADLRDVLERHPKLRLIVADRERAFPRRFELPTHTLSPLGSDERTTIATGLVADPTAVVADLENRLGNVVDNPLLFVMALALTRVGIAATGRAAIFAGFIDGLRERTKQTTLDETDMAALRLVAVDLTREDRFDADRYWWLATLAAALSHLREGGVYEVGERTAEAVFSRLLDTGLLFEDDVAASVSLLHDAFRDYLASVALARREAEVPRPVDATWEQAFELLAEQGGLTPEQARALATDNPVAATRSARFDRGPADAHLTGELARRLAASHLGSAPCGVDFGVVLVRGLEHVYAFVACNGGDAERSSEEAAALAAESSFVVGLGSEAGSLSFAAALWREFVKKLTASEPPMLQRPVPASTAELVEAVAEQFREQRAELEALARRLVPTLAERLVAGVGWSGLRAELGEAQTTPLLPDQQLTYHPMRYSFGGDEVIVTVAENDDRAEFATRGTAEGFIELPPRAVAIKALVDELNRLLPEIN